VIFETFLEVWECIGFVGILPLVKFWNYQTAT
jgi:hypothetical protein